MVGFRIQKIGKGNFSASSVFLFVYVRSTEPSRVFDCQVVKYYVLID